MKLTCTYRQSFSLCVFLLLIRRASLVGLTTAAMFGCQGRPVGSTSSPVALSPARSSSAIARTAFRIVTPNMPEEEPPRDAPANFPHVVVDELVYHFGVMAPHELKSHRFKVRNDGAAPLRLQKISTSCKCTLVQLPTEEILPGDEREIEIQWTSRQSGDTFSQTATIKTNDPENEILQLRVEGEVRNEIAVDPPMFYLPRTRLDRETTATVFVTSQRWGDFSIDDVESSLENLSWEITPASSTELDAVHASSGWKIEITLPKDLDEGNFRHALQLVVKKNSPRGDQPNAESKQLEIPILGKVLRRIAVYGKNIDNQGTIHFGTLLTGKEHKLRFLVKVHDELPRLTLTDVQATPDFLEVQLQPYSKHEGSQNIYRLDVLLPATAPEGVHQAERLGQIRLAFDHPRIHELVMKVEFILHNSTLQSLSSTASTR